jgi:hypothetical protein
MATNRRHVLVIARGMPFRQGNRGSWCLVEQRIASNVTSLIFRRSRPSESLPSVLALMTSIVMCQQCANSCQSPNGERGRTIDRTSRTPLPYLA